MERWESLKVKAEQCMQTGDCEQAERIWREICHLLPEKSVMYSFALRNLADSIEAQGRLESAIVVMTECLSATRQHFGYVHPNTAHVLHKLSGLYFAKAHFQQAKVMCEQALTIYADFFAEHGNSWIEVAGNLALIYEQLSDSHSTSTQERRARIAPQKEVEWKKFCDINSLLRLCAA